LIFLYHSWRSRCPWEWDRPPGPCRYPWTAPRTQRLTVEPKSSVGSFLTGSIRKISGEWLSEKSESHSFIWFRFINSYRAQKITCRIYPSHPSPDKSR
jgi:hypothetical protein